MEDDTMELQELLREIDSIYEYCHISESGISHEKIQKLKAIQTDDELTQIIYLVDSHVPGLRATAAMRYQRLASVSETSNEHKEELYFLRDLITTKCNMSVSMAVSELKNRIAALPKEWTVVQVTKHYNPMEDQNLDTARYYTDGMFISVFNCGQSTCDPFLISIDSPKLNGVKLELCQLLMDTLIKLHEQLKSVSKRKNFRNHKEKSDYLSKIESAEAALKDIVKHVENWLGAWKCLFIGKFIDESIEQMIRNELDNILKEQLNDIKLPQKSIELLYHIAKGGFNLIGDDLFNGIEYCLKDFCKPNIIQDISVLVKQLSVRLHSKSSQERSKHPVILVIDEAFDSLPWEMMEVLQDQPVSRVPSFHFVYFLFKVHEENIEGGHKIVKNYENGKFIVNPDGDLENMSQRILSFYRYWLPKWDGMHDEKPSHDQFSELLKSADIFAYNGHGNGTHIMVLETLQQIKLKAVVLLFGCASTRICRMGPQVGTYGSYHMFLISRCPCVLGMLWPVTDVCTDIFTTNFLSSWLPSEAPIPWSDVYKENWKLGKWALSEKNKEFTAKSKAKSSKKNYNLELPRALVDCRSKSQHYLTKAACVVRGIPVKIKLQ